MLVRSKAQCGYRRDGGVLLQKGENQIDEKTLTSSERAFIAALAKAGVVVVDPFPLKVVPPPPSEPATDEPVTEIVPEVVAMPEEAKSAPVVIEESKPKRRHRKAS